MSNDISEKQTVLIVEDLDINRQILRNMLGGEYNVVEAANGAEAFVRLASTEDIAAILLDIVMPVMDGYEFLERLRDTPYSAVPVIAVTGEKDAGTERKALRLGAWDFVSKPYQADVLMMRLKNVIMRSQFYLLSEMKHAYEYDALTGLYNRTKFFDETRRLLERNNDLKFALIRFDIDHFHILNSFWGEEEGDRFLRFIADSLRGVSKCAAPCTFAHISADTFCICEPFDSEAIRLQVDELCSDFAGYNTDYVIEPSFGVYVIEDVGEKIQTMLERATLAAKMCKGKYMTFMCYYKPEMSRKVEQEQLIVGEMQNALDTEQFEVYLQPKYNLKTERPYGAEALIRWRHPKYGLLSPGLFIPVFERNGFIGKIDYYMWEKTCRLLRKWLDEGENPAPISVNVSRVNMYKPNLVGQITELVKKYDIPPRLLNLEVTESAYMDNPDVMSKTVLALRRAGFVVMMDDFGSGYSSLNTLKDIPIDILKIDMKFLSGGADEGRKECIMASVVHMAGWLEIPVIMEGVETESQVDFLKSIGCGYVQGFYYAKPMPVADYEALVRGSAPAPIESLSVNHDALVHTIWSSNTHIDLLFNSIKRPAAIYEFEDGSFSAIRVNSDFNSFFGYGEEISSAKERERHHHLSPESLSAVTEAFRRVSETHGESGCTYAITEDGQRERLVSLSLKYWGANENADIVFALFSDA
jgi:EAL domain-containing protein (putative c-di-GMP-specific phosphodiesterase class I)/DNA-binding response OmpR family regulator